MTFNKTSRRAFRSRSSASLSVTQASPCRAVTVRVEKPYTMRDFRTAAVDLPQAVSSSIALLMDG